MLKKLFYSISFCLPFSCTNTVSIENENRLSLIATYQLVVSDEKKILLDNETAPKPPYMQILTGKSGEQMLTFFNPYKRAIYFYDYENAFFIGKSNEFERQGPNAIPGFAGYFIKNMDSIYVYCRSLELVLTDSTAQVKQRISLRGGRTDRNWVFYFPQYLFSTLNSIIENRGKLIFTGMSPFSIADSLINKFKLTSLIDLETSSLKFVHTYPKELYGSNANWQEPMFMQPYTELTPEGKMIYSFPVSHNLYIAALDAEEYKIVYGGSKVAGTIHSIADGRERTPNELILSHLLQQDLYSGIIHDPYRNVYYRFMHQGIPDANFSVPIGKKNVIVIIMDEQFNYLGETAIGAGEEWNWQNSFVTTEGLVIEHIDISVDSGEEFLILKTFSIKEL